MYLRVAKVLTITCALLLGSVLAPAQESKWKDRAEYDMFQEMSKETDPAKKVEKIKAWRNKYPESFYKKEGLGLELLAYVQLGKAPELAATAKQILAIDPVEVTSLFYLASMAKNATAADVLDSGEKAASKLANEADKVFADDRKPAQSTAEQWTSARKDMEVLGNKTLGYIAMTRKEYDKAETSLKKALELKSNDGEIAYWMYTIIRAMKKIERYSEALFYLARAASLTADKGGLPDANRKQVDDFFVKAYNTFHGQDDEGLKQLRAMAIERYSPPDGFKIKDAATIAHEKEEEFKKSNPQLAFWMGLKGALSGPEGESYFKEKVKGAGLPGPIEGTQFTRLKGKLVSTKPAVNPKELVLLLDTTQSSTGSTGEVTLKLDAPLRGKADSGIEIEFEGIAAEFTKDPAFMVTFEVEKDKLVGWPVQAGAPPAKKAGGATKKAGAPKKK